LVIAAALGAVLWAAGRLWVVFVPLLVAVFLTRILASPAGWLGDHGWRPGLAAAVTLVSFLLVLAATATVIGAAVADEFSALGPTLSDALDDVERWLVEDSPFDVSRAEVERFRREAGQRLGDAVRGSGGALVSGAAVVAEVVLGLVVGLIVTFFALKDGGRFVAWVQRLVPAERRQLASRLGLRSWRTLGGYLRGAALLGLVEGTAIAIALKVVGAKLALPMAVVTFIAAFVPVVGAIVAGVLATLVTLATAGGAEAAIVAIVALVVQQLDNDVLAPVVYGRALELHPVVVLLGILAGGAAFGLPGSFLAVPVVAVMVNAIAESHAYRQEAPGV
jgi:putative heme transporter